MSPGASVSELKRLLSEASGASVGDQRLIFRGKVMRDDALSPSGAQAAVAGGEGHEDGAADPLTLAEYGVEDGDTLHMVVRPAGVSPPGGTQGEPSPAAAAIPPAAAPVAATMVQSVHIADISLGEGGGMPDLGAIVGQMVAQTQHEVERQVAQRRGGSAPPAPGTQQPQQAQPQPQGQTQTAQPTSQPPQPQQQPRPPTALAAVHACLSSFPQRFPAAGRAYGPHGPRGDASDTASVHSLDLAGVERLRGTSDAGGGGSDGDDDDVFSDGLHDDSRLETGSVLSIDSGVTAFSQSTAFSTAATIGSEFYHAAARPSRGAEAGMPDGSEELGRQSEGADVAGDDGRLALETAEAAEAAASVLARRAPRALNNLAALLRASARRSGGSGGGGGPHGGALDTGTRRRRLCHELSTLGALLMELSHVGGGTRGGGMAAATAAAASAGDASAHAERSPQFLTGDGRPAVMPAQSALLRGLLGPLMTGGSGGPLPATAGGLGGTGNSSGAAARGQPQVSVHVMEIAVPAGDAPPATLPGVPLSSERPEAPPHAAAAASAPAETANEPAPADDTGHLLLPSETAGAPQSAAPSQPQVGEAGAESPQPSTAEPPPQSAGGGRSAAANDAPLLPEEIPAQTEADDQEGEVRQQAFFGLTV